MDNTLARRSQQVRGGRSFQQTTVTTTTTTSYSENRAGTPFNNGGQGQYNNHNSAASGGLRLSSKAQMMMAMMGMMKAMMTGDFGQLMQMMNGMNGQQMPQGYGPVQTQGGPPQGVPRKASFGEPRQAAAGSNLLALKGAGVSPMKPGAVKEMKPGQTSKGANGTVVQWGKDGNVKMTYQDKNGQNKKLSVKDGMLIMDGQKPVKLENVGQLLKLPNGDVVGLGNSQGPNGKSLVRVVMSDAVKNIKTEPASATNIYDVGSMDRKVTNYEGGGMSLNLSAGSFQTPMGSGSFMNLNFSQFLGNPVTRTMAGPLTLAFGGVK